MNEYSAAAVAPIAGVPADVVGGITSFFAVLLVIAALVALLAGGAAAQEIPRRGGIIDRKAHV